MGSKILVYTYPSFGELDQYKNDIHINLCDLFARRFPVNNDWESVKDRIVEKFTMQEMGRLMPPVELYLNCGLSVAYLIGSLWKRMYGLNLQIMQKNRAGFFENWSVKPEDKEFFKEFEKPGISPQYKLIVPVTQPIMVTSLGSDNPGMFNPPEIRAKFLEGEGMDTIKNGAQAWAIAFELQRKLKEILPPQTEMLHLYLSAPVALACILGNVLHSIVPKVQLYEYDLENNRGYSPSILIANEQ